MVCNLCIGTFVIYKYMDYGLAQRLYDWVSFREKDEVKGVDFLLFEPDLQGSIRRSPES